jgi:hypothetical protein
VTSGSVEAGPHDLGQCAGISPDRLSGGESVERGGRGLRRSRRPQENALIQRRGGIRVGRFGVVAGSALT